MASRGCNHFPDAFCYICGQFIKTRAKKFSVTASAKMVKNSYFGIKKKIIPKATRIMTGIMDIFFCFPMKRVGK